MTVKFNGYFHGNEAFKTAQKAINEGHVDNYDSLLTIYQYGDYDLASGQFSNLDRAIKKAAKMIDRHSMLIRIKREETQVNYMIDDCYLLMGKAQFYKKDFESAIKTFDYLINNHKSNLTTHRARLFKLQCYIFSNQSVNFETELKKIKEDEAFPEKLELMLFETEAMYSIQNLDYVKAVLFLEKAIEKENKRKRKNRLIFILAQLNERLGEPALASKHFKTVADKALNYELGFQAKMKYALISADKNKGEIIGYLNALAKDDKNKEYLDQIYFVRAKVHQENMEPEEAVKYFKKSAWSSVKNPKQKALAYFELGEFYYFEKSYRDAQVYLDSSLQSLPQSHPQYERTRTKAESLTDLVDALDVIALQDSLQALASLDEFERIKAIEKVIEQVEQEEIQQKQKDAIVAAKELQNAQSSPAFKNNSGVVWIFDNPQALSAGYAEFVKRWGNRELTDDWRRADKSSADFNVNEENQSTQTAEIDENKTIDFYMNQLPLSEEDIIQSNQLIAENLLKAAEIYNYKLNDVPESNKYLQRYLNEFQSEESHASSAYQLYRNYAALGEAEKANETKKLILENYPTSDYANLIANPEQNERAVELRKEFNRIYERIFGLYQQEQHNSVIEECDKILSTTKENPLEADFVLLKAFSRGKLEGPEVFEQDLQKIQTEYSESSAGATATLLLNRIKRSRDEALLKKQKKQTEEKEFQSHLGKQHALIIVVTDEVNKPSKIKQEVALFNDQFFSGEDFKVQVLGFGEGESVIIVQWMKDDARALEYYKVIKSKMFDKNDSIKNRYFPISQENLKLFIEYKELEKYYAFFKKNYQL